MFIYFFIIIISLVPYGYVVILSDVCSLLSSLLLKRVFNVFSVQSLIAKKKKEFFEKKFKECIGKPKDLWKAIKSLGLPIKSGGCIGALAENQIVKHDTKSILKTVKIF